MALTTAQQISLFQILDVPYGTSYNTLDGMGSLTAQTDINIATAQAYTVILAAVAALESDVETVLTALITEWDAIGLNSGRIESGGVGDLAGASFDWDRKRQLIRERVQVILPFYRWHEVLARRSATGHGVNISVERL